MIIETADDDDRVKTNYLSTVLFGAVRSWPVNPLEITVQSWNHPYALFLGNFQGTYEWPATTETLETI
jgi:hypothetical protein